MKAIVLPLFCLFLSSCASHFNGNGSSDGFAGNAPPEGYVFGESDDPLDFRKNGDMPNLLDDAAWAQYESGYDAPTSGESTAPPSYRPTQPNPPTRPVIASTQPVRTAPSPVRRVTPKPASKPAAPKLPVRTIAKTSTPAPSPPAKPTRVASKPASPSTHQVGKGDTLWNLSKRYNVSLPALQSANGLPDTNIRLGQNLTIPKAGTSVAAATPSVRPAAAHVVQPGETLWRISQKHGVSVDRIRLANNLSGDMLKIGDRLQIP